MQLALPSYLEMALTSDANDVCLDKLDEHFQVLIFLSLSVVLGIALYTMLLEHMLPLDCRIFSGFAPTSRPFFWSPVQVSFPCSTIKYWVSSGSRWRLSFSSLYTFPLGDPIHCNGCNCHLHQMSSESKCVARSCSWASTSYTHCPAALFSQWHFKGAVKSACPNPSSTLSSR